MALLLALHALGSPMNYELFAYEPAADPKAVVVAGSARFTVLTPRLLRMEYSAAGKFEDRATLAFVDRKQPVPPFTWDGKQLKTAALTLTYEGGAFSPSSLKVAPAAAAAGGAFKGWAFGQTSATDPGNLRGTLRTLDRAVNISLDCNDHHKGQGDDFAWHCEWGVVSRSGWALVDETGVPCLDAEHDWWADASGRMLKNSDDIDHYLFAHGHDYVGALADLTAVGGKVPVLPRHNLGVWFTRWYDFDAADVHALVGAFPTHSMPLDVLVLDMNWHAKDDWTGSQLGAEPRRSPKP